MKTNGYVSTKDFCEQLRLKLEGIDPEREDAFLYVRRNEPPAWCRKELRGETPSEAWGRKLRLQRAYSSCDQALAGL
jgi:hypothetical protein